MNAGTMCFTGVFNDFGDNLQQFVHGWKESLTVGEHVVLQGARGRNKGVDVNGDEAQDAFPARRAHSPFRPTVQR